ncbi:hypothetical protein RHS03_06077, partial [Rhizoctonia solani]
MNDVSVPTGTDTAVAFPTSAALSAGNAALIGAAVLRGKFLKQYTVVQAPSHQALVATTVSLLSMASAAVPMVVSAVLRPPGR